MQLDIENNWRTVPGWDGLYEVSIEGEVRSLTRIVKGRYGPTRYKGRLLRPGFSTGYALVTLVETGQGRRQQFYVHDLVLAAFVGPKPIGLEVCHGESGALVNKLTNLRYDTRSANANDRKLFGKPWIPRGQKPATFVRCQICDHEFPVRRRRTSSHICSAESCRRLWGKRCVQRKRKDKKALV